jgi:hypothetical protein
MGERRGAYSVLVERPVEIRPLVWPKHRWLDNIKMNLQEELVRSGSGYGQLAASYERAYEASVSIKCGEFLD